MKGDRRRIVVDDAYLKAIGAAVYSFAILEWNAVYCGEKLKPGYLRKVARKTAGCIAKDVTKFAPRIKDSDKRARYRAAVEFTRLVGRRNNLVHANPATIGNEQRLYRRGKAWQLCEINELADEFAICSIELNELYYRVL